MALSDAYARALGRLGAATLESLQAFEAAQRRLHPPWIPELRQRLGPRHERLAGALAAWRAIEPPEELAAFHEQFAEGAAHTEAALARFLEVHAGPEGILASWRSHARAQESLYPLRAALPPLAGFFVEPAFRDARPLDPEREDASGAPSVGLHRGGDATAGGEDGRGGFSLYVPEWYDGSEPWPLVVALHGGSGCGRDFLFTWLREARGRGFLLLAPTSRGPTWALDAPGLDQLPLLSMLRYVAERWRVDPDRILLTGLSDGATMSLLLGLAEDAPFSHLAPVSGVLHPANFTLGNLARAADRPVYLVHGALDWLFPVALARGARDALTEAGARLCYRELADLSHTYPRDENARILEWFDPGLAPAAPPSAAPGAAA
jgi:phospholipase/carboxylesterase